MASLLIRNVDAALHARLKAHAAARHRSLEEEATLHTPPAMRTFARAVRRPVCRSPSRMQ